MRITRIFFDTHMALGFDGLRAVVKKAKSKLGPDTNVVFVNKKTTSFKVVVNDAYLVYYKNGNRRIPLEALAHLPQAFGGTEMEMNEAIRKSLASKLNIEI